ncbi:MAG: hypothetical protein KAV87_45105 [Desulfobacteraceae bacterium]|nr:hypothetical protein [Desulfobacteraceae bacterium]
MPSIDAPPWSEDNWRESILRYQLRVKGETIERLAEKFEYAGDFPTDTPVSLARLIKHTAHVLVDHLPTTPPDQLMHVNLLLCSIAEHLRFVDRSRVANTPWSMIQYTEEFLERQTGASNEFIIRPQWAYNYSLIGEFVEVIRTKIEPLDWIPTATWKSSLCGLGDQKIYCLSFPRIERLNCLLHANWGHEIGHIFAKQWIDNNFAQMWSSEETQIKNRIEREIQQEIQRNPPPVDPLFAKFVVQEMAADQVNDAMQVAKDGLTELICDAIGIHLLGPAALAAACEFSAPLPIDESPLKCDMYPPWRYRIRLMAEMCGDDLQEQTVQLGDVETKYPGPVIEPFWNWLKETKLLAQNTADKEALNSDIRTREAYRLIEDKWEAIRAQALQALPRESAECYRLFKRVRVIENLVRRLEQDTPPNEIGTWPDNSPASLENILNAAWVFKIAKIRQDPDWVSTDNFEKLCRLVLKATEVAFVHSTYGEQLKNLEE